MKKVTIKIIIAVFIISVLFIGYDKFKYFGDEVFVLSKNINKENPQKGHIVQIKSRGSIYVVSDLDEVMLQSEENQDFHSYLNKEGVIYHITNKKVLEKLKFGQKVTVYNNGFMNDSSPGQTVATKIIVH
jgi:hypothetical protein